MDTYSDTQREEQEGGGDGGNKTFNTWDELRMQLSDQPFKQRNRRKHAWLYLVHQNNGDHGEDQNPCCLRKEWGFFCLFSGEHPGFSLIGYHRTRKPDGGAHMKSE